jgi:hypothetical protein
MWSWGLLGYQLHSTSGSRLLQQPCAAWHFCLGQSQPCIAENDTGGPAAFAIHKYYQNPSLMLQGHGLARTFDELSPMTTFITKTLFMASVMKNAVNHCSMVPPPPKTQNPRRPLSAEDWEEQRATIQRLYSTEDRNLQEVMEVMKREYGFCATYACLPFSELISLQYNG